MVVTKNDKERMEVYISGITTKKKVKNARRSIDRASWKSRVI